MTGHRVNRGILALLCAALILGMGACTAGNQNRGAGEKTDQEGTFEASPAAGILFTKPSGGKSSVVWLDEKLKKTDETEYAFSASYYDGFRNMCCDDGKVYLFPRGDYEKKDATKLQIIDLADGSCRQVESGRCNVTGYDADQGRIAFSSNENGTCYVDLMDEQTGEMKEMEAEDVTVFDVVLYEDLIYGMALDDDLRVKLMSFDPAQDRQQIILELSDDDTPGFLQVYDGSLLFVTDGKLGRYDIKTGRFKQTELTREGAFNLNISGNTLWIAYTDVFNSGKQESLIEARSLEDMSVTAQEAVSGPVLQMEVSADTLWVLSDDKLITYRVSDTGLSRIGEMHPEREGFDVGGIFVSDRKYGGLSDSEALDLQEDLVEEADRIEVVQDKK